MKKSKGWSFLYVSVSVLLALAFPAWTYKHGWDFTYPLFPFVWLISIVTSLVLSGIILAISIVLATREDKAVFVYTTRILAIATFLFGAIPHLPYNTWKLGVKHRFFSVYETKGIGDRVLAEAKRTKEYYGEDTIIGSYDRWDDAVKEYREASLFAEDLSRLSVNYPKINLDGADQPYIQLDDSGGFLNPWGVIIGPPDLDPVSFRYSRIEQWAPGIFFYDSN